MRDLGIPFVHEAELEYGVKGMFVGGDIGLISCTKALSIIQIIAYDIVSR